MTPFIPELLAKLTLILALGLIVNAALRSFSASLRHLILFATIASALALPFAMFFSPWWEVPVLPPSLATNLASPSAGASALARHGVSIPMSDSRSLNARGNADSIGSGLIARLMEAGSVRSRATARNVLTSLALLPIVWALGFLTIMGWLAVGRIRLDRIAASSWPLNGSDWSEILDEVGRDTGVGKPVLLFSSSVVCTPLTWGSRAPVILVPEDALDWSDAHRRIVLRHELAHVARNDSFAQLVAGFVCALYWFHPLAWMAERRLRAECERACDDSVVSLGTPPAEYAAHLLEVARSARAFGAPGLLSVAMARPSQLEGRLLAVLNESRRRVSLSRGARPAAVLVSALVLLPLAAFRPVAKVVHEPPRQGMAPATLSRSAGSPPSFKAFSASLVKSNAGTDASISRLSPDDKALVSSRKSVDSTFQITAPAKSGGTLTLALRTGGEVVITGWDKPEVRVRASLRGRDRRDIDVTLQRVDSGARLESDYNRLSNNQSSHQLFEINVPRSFNIRLSSGGGSFSLTDVDGVFTGHTGGGEISIQRATGEVDIRTGGGDVHVSNARLSGTVSTGGGLVRIEDVTGNLNGSSGSGPVTYIRSGGGATKRSFDIMGVERARTFAANGIRMNSAVGAIVLPAAPDGAHVTTGKGRIWIGPSGGEVYASTGGGPIEIGPATGSVDARTGAGDVTIQLDGAGMHSVDVLSGKGDIVLILPPELDATLDLETAYTSTFGRQTRIVSDWPLTIVETSTWDTAQGTPRRYVRARQNLGRGGSLIRVRTVNGDVRLRRSR